MSPGLDAQGFPDPRAADAEGLVAVGLPLTRARMLHAYAHGIFPWPHGNLPMLWFSPDPRAVLQVDTLHVSRRLARTLRQGRFTLSWNRCFARVVQECARRRREGTWIVPELAAAYLDLHQSGAAHSLEVWRDEALVGGLFGIQRGALFCGDSMFSRVSDASKVALVACVRSVFAAGVRLFDVQLLTPHLARMGAREWARDHYLAAAARAVTMPVDLGGIVPAAT